MGEFSFPAGTQNTEKTGAVPEGFSERSNNMFGIDNWFSSLWAVNDPGACWELVVRIFVGGLCGAAIGLERSIRQKEAGIRTHCIVALAAALFMVLSKYAFTDMEGFAGVRGADPSRIASGVVSAIGFLGAGIIFRRGDAVKGLTTAAGIWATAGIGMCIGCGLYTVGIASTLLVLLVNICLHKWLFRLEAMSTSEFSFVMLDHPDVLSDLRSQLDKHKIQVQSLDMRKKEDGTVRVRIVARIAKNAALNDFLAFLNQNEEIRDFSVEV